MDKSRQPPPDHVTQAAVREEREGGNAGGLEGWLCGRCLVNARYLNKHRSMLTDASRLSL